MDENEEYGPEECGSEEEYGPDLLTLTDDDGVSHTFELLDSLEMDEKEYVALVQTYDDDNLGAPGELIILRRSSEDGGDFLVGIEDEEEFDKISRIFMKRLEDYYEFTED